jgi:arylformamidase
MFPGVVHLSGIFDLKPIVSTYVNEAVGMSLEEAESNSPLSEKNVEKLVENLIEKRQNFRTMILVGQYESPAFIQQGENLAKVLSLLFVIYGGGGEGGAGGP